MLGLAWPPGESRPAVLSLLPASEVPPAFPASGPHSDTYWLLGVIHLLHGEVLKGYDSPWLLVLQEWGSGSAPGALRPWVGSELVGLPKPEESVPIFLGVREQHRMSLGWELGDPTLIPSSASALGPAPPPLCGSIFPSVKWVWQWIV